MMSSEKFMLYRFIGISLLIIIIGNMICERMSNMDEEKYSMKFTTGEYKSYVKEALLNKEDIEQMKKGMIIKDFYVKGDDKHRYQMVNLNKRGCEGISKNKEFFLWNANYFTENENKKKYYLINANPFWNKELILNIDFKHNEQCEVVEVDNK